MEHRDVVVLGAGPAGYVCAIRLAQLGKKVTVIDQDQVGGVCLNRGCIPSKALIHAGSLFEEISGASQFGIEVKGASIHLPQLMKWKDSVVSQLTGGIDLLLKANGCSLIQGKARFISPKSLEITMQGSSGLKKQIEFDIAVIATGSRPASLPGIPIDQERILDSTGGLNLQKIPRSMLCIGGGYIGLELGSFYSKIGSKVTIVEASGGLLSGVDPDLTQVVSKKLKKNNVSIYLKTFVRECKTLSKGGVEVVFFDGNAEKKETFETVLVTVGRIPNSDTLDLANAGLKLDASGFIAVDSQQRTAVSHLFAIGDIAGQPLLAHKGSKQGLVAAEVIAGKKVSYDIVAMPAVIFTDPEIATVGLTEQEAKAQGFKVHVGVFPYSANGRALSLSQPEGMVKVIGDAETGRLLGVHIVGADASHLISEAALALELGAYVEDLALTVHPHPTISETLMEASEVFLGQAVHLFQKKKSSASKL